MSSGNDYWSGIFGRVGGQSIQDAERAYLLANGATSANNADMWNQLLVSGGYTGALNDMKRQWIAAGAVFASAPTTYMQQGTVADLAITAAHASHYPSKKYEIVWGGTMKWVSDPYASNFLAKWNPGGANQSFLFRFAGASRFIGIHCIGSVYACNSNAATPFVDDELGWVKIVVDVVGSTTFFYTSYDGVEWTQLGDAGVPHQGNEAYIPVKSAGLTIGGNEADIAAFAQRSHYAAIQHVDGPEILVDFDASGHAGETSFANDYGDTWTISGGATLVDI